MPKILVDDRKYLWLWFAYLYISSQRKNTSRLSLFKFRFPAHCRLWNWSEGEEMASLSRLQTIARSLKRNPLPYSSAKLYHPCEATQLASSLRTIAPPQCLPSVPGYWQLQSRRTLILEPATSASESVKLNRLSDSDSGTPCFAYAVSLGGWVCEV